jgi:hypothetical protein
MPILHGHLIRPGVRVSRWNAANRCAPFVDDLQPERRPALRPDSPGAAADHRVTVLSGRPVAALNAPASNADPLLMPRDRITVFDLQSSRDRVIKPLPTIQAAIQHCVAGRSRAVSTAALNARRGIRSRAA